MYQLTLLYIGCDATPYPYTQPFVEAVCLQAVLERCDLFRLMLWDALYPIHNLDLSEE